MKPSTLYQRLCNAPDLDAAAARLSLAELAAVAEYIATLPKGGGVPAQIGGVITAKINELQTSKP